MFKGRAALVTGSTSGIGLGIAERLAAGGAHIVLNGLGEAAAIASLRAKLADNYGVAVGYDGADMSNPQAIERMIARALDRFGALDIVVNNAGIQHVAPVDEFPVEKWNAILAINLSSAFHTTAAAIPGMRKAKWGRIVNIASAHGLTASPFKSAYVSAKHGLVGFTKTVALELAEEHVTCNAICPGYVLTPLVEGQIADQMKVHNLSRERVVKEVMLQRQPTHEFARVEEIGALAVFLCSDAAKQITGTTLSVDGGWTAL